MSENGSTGPSRAPTRPSSANPGAAVSKRQPLSAAARSKIETLRHYAILESTAKANSLQIEALRRSGKHSTNLLMRAMQLDKPIFADGTIASLDSSSSLARTSATRHIATLHEPPMEDYVNGGAGVLLSRGAVPSVIPGKYVFGGVPETKDWSTAAARQKELKEALQTLEAEISSNESALMTKTKWEAADPATTKTTFTQDPNSASAKFTPVIKGGSQVLGSSFKWRGTQCKSANVESFAWPSTYDHRYSSWAVGATKYGMLSHECDVPGGSVYIKHGTGGKKKKR